MPANLDNEVLVTKIQALSELTRDAREEGGGLAARVRAYETALAAFWRADFGTAADLASQLLADEPDSAARHQAYRLWIESLAEQGDKASLRCLKDHLFTRGQAEPDEHTTYAALRGVAHFELDEMQAARLLAKAMKDEVQDPYALELVQLVERRLSEAGAPETLPSLLRATSPIVDYFHWQSIARSFVGRQGGSEGREPLVETLLVIREHHRGAPLPLVAEYHAQMESGLYAGAAIYADRLCELYPENVDYQYYRAFAQFEDGNYPTARAILQTVVSRFGADDPEVVGLLGHCFAKLGEPEQAKRHLMRAASLLRSEGMPSSHVRLELANVEEELRGDAVDPAVEELPRESRMWVVNLSARRYHELMTASESAVDRLLRPMGTSPRNGDFVLFTSPPEGDQSGTTEWNIVAIYTVDSEPLWHPVYRHHTALKLVVRMNHAIPMEIQAAPEAEGTVTERPGADDPIRFGVYEIEQGHALDIIERAIEQQKNGIIERRAQGGKARRPSA